MPKRPGKNPKRKTSTRVIGRSTILTGDCLARLPELQERAVDVVVTSPPYNIGVGYKTYADAKSRLDYLDWLRQVALELHRVLADDGSFFLNIGGTAADPALPMETCLKIKEVFALQNHILWVKSISIGGDSFGHFKPIQSRRYLNHNFEHVFHFTKSGQVELDRLAIGVPFKHKSNIKRWGHPRDLRCAGNVWFIPYETVVSKSGKFDHPAIFPVELAERCIKLHGNKNAVVLDPFLGTGTTLVAAENLKCRGIGIDLDSHYCDIAVSRLKALAKG